MRTLSIVHRTSSIVHRTIRLILACLLAGVPGSPAVSQTTAINLVFIGNSITYGATLADPSTQAPPVLCGQLIEAATGVPTHVYNGGHSGITTFGFMPGRDDFARAVAAATELKKNGGRLYFSIMLGTNDSAIRGTEGAPVSPDTYKANMQAIIDTLVARFPDSRIVVNYPIWYSPNTHNGATYMEEGMNRLHSYYPVIDRLPVRHWQVTGGNRGVWEYFRDSPDLFTHEQGYDGIFYLHPNAIGARRLAEIWSRSLLHLIAADGIPVDWLKP